MDTVCVAQVEMLRDGEELDDGELELELQSVLETDTLLERLALLERCDEALGGRLAEGHGDAVGDALLDADGIALREARLESDTQVDTVALVDARAVGDCTEERELEELGVLDTLTDVHCDGDSVGDRDATRETVACAVADWLSDGVPLKLGVWHALTVPVVAGLAVELLQAAVDGDAPPLMLELKEGDTEPRVD